MTLKTTASAPQFWEELQIRFGRLANQTYRTVQIGILNNSFSELVSGIGGVALLWYGSSLVIGDRLSIGQLLAFNSMNGNLLALITMTIIATVIQKADWIVLLDKGELKLESTPAQLRSQSGKHLAFLGSEQALLT